MLTVRQQQKETTLRKVYKCCYSSSSAADEAPTSHTVVLSGDVERILRTAVQLDDGDGGNLPTIHIYIRMRLEPRLTRPCRSGKRSQKYHELTTTKKIPSQFLSNPVSDGQQI